MIATAARMGIALTETHIEQLRAFHARLNEANQYMNLTRVSEEERESFDRNDLDALAPLGIPGLLDGARTLIDVGSGAGFPGIPLAIARPDIHIVLLDALEKRVQFLNGVIEALGLNAEAIHFRAEDAAKRPEYRDAFDVATARAVAAMNVLVEWTLPFVRTGGRLLAYKGPSVETELAEADTAIGTLNGRVGGVYPVPIPDRDWDHRIAVVEKIGPTPERFPRRAGMATKKPLKNPG